MSKPTVLFLDHTARMGGGEIAILNLIRALDTSQYTPVVALASNGPLVDELRRSGVETHVFDLDSSIVDTRKDSLRSASFLRIKQAVRVFRYASRLAKWARSRGVDVIHTNSLKSDIYGGVAGRLAGIPVIWHVRDNISTDYLPRLAVKTFRLLARIVPTVVITNSAHTLRTLGISKTEPSEVVYSGIAKFPAEAHQTAGTMQGGRKSSPFTWPEKPVVALIGRIAEWKGQHVFIHAASELMRRAPWVRFWIVGSPLFGELEYEASLRTLVEDCGLGENVEFLGFRSDVQDLLKDVSIVVHASTIGEPFGQVVIEGMAAGKPVVATDGGALPEIIVPGESGMLVPMGDSHAMAEAIEWLFSHPQEAYSIAVAGRERVSTHFTIAHTVAKVQAVYDQILPGKLHGSSSRPRRGIAIAIADGIAANKI